MLAVCGRSLKCMMFFKCCLVKVIHFYGFKKYSLKLLFYIIALNSPKKLWLKLVWVLKTLMDNTFMLSWKNNNNKTYCRVSSYIKNILQKSKEIQQNGRKGIVQLHKFHSSLGTIFSWCRFHLVKHLRTSINMMEMWNHRPHQGINGVQEMNVFWCKMCEANPEQKRPCEM